MDNISILHFNDYAMVRMKQTYSSNLVDDTGLKTLYVKTNDNNEWKIIKELWEKYTPSKSLASSKTNEYFE
jgi:hypothetical protein